MNVISFIVAMVMVWAVSMVGGMALGERTATERNKKDAVRNGVGFYSADREKGEVKFYWLVGGTNVVEYMNERKDK